MKTLQKKKKKKKKKRRRRRGENKGASDVTFNSQRGCYAPGLSAAGSVMRC